jgi:predicted dinucleotide-binding enzyme
MNIAVLGTGTVGRAVAARLDELGHRVTVGTRDPEATLARTDDGGASYGQWADAHSGVGLARFADAARDADLVVNATSGQATLAVLALAGAETLAEKTLLDISNPLDFSAGMPPTLFVKDDDSLAEQVQRSFPETRVVKSLNTLTADLMVHPETLPDASSVFVSGDDADAKAQVTDLLTQLGHRDVIDLGDISTARGTEMYLPLWLRLWGALGSATFNLKIVR